MSSVSAQILLRMAYETDFSIHDHLNSRNNPLDSVKLFDCEKYREVSPMYAAIKRYASLGIGEHFKISLLEYLSLPHEMIEMLSEATRDIEKKIQSIREDVEGNLNASNRKNK